MDLRIERDDTMVTVFLGDERIGSAALTASGPCLIMVSANSAGVPEAGTRFGTLTVQRLS